MLNLIQLQLFFSTVRKARKSAQAYFREYRETKPVGQLVKSTASVMQEYTQSGGVRPFGVSLLVAGMDGDGVPRLFQVDPSGAYFGWKATAIGKVSVGWEVIVCNSERLAILRNPYSLLTILPLHNQSLYNQIKHRDT